MLDCNKFLDLLSGSTGILATKNLPGRKSLQLDPSLHTHKERAPFRF